MIAICFSTVIGEYCGCFKISTFLLPLSSTAFVEASRSEPNLENASSSRNWAWSSFNVPATFFIDLICAFPPTLDTLIPTLIAGRTPALKRLVSRNIWPSVMDITFVGIYADTSPACVSIIGKAVKDPPPFTIGFRDSGRSFMLAATSSDWIIFAALSSKRECK